jgi:hypothetical protein
MLLDVVLMSVSSKLSAVTPAKEDLADCAPHRFPGAFSCMAIPERVTSLTFRQFAHWLFSA